MASQQNIQGMSLLPPFSRPWPQAERGLEAVTSHFKGPPLIN